ncbi:hypothetical protein ACWENA_13915 [Streptomyces sp. NPDC004779]
MADAPRAADPVVNEGAGNAGNAPADVARTTLRYAPNQAGRARKLAALMGLPAAH